jgi:hypothetical protein
MALYRDCCEKFYGELLITDYPDDSSDLTDCAESIHSTVPSEPR